MRYRFVTPNNIIPIPEGVNPEHHLRKWYAQSGGNDDRGCIEVFIPVCHICLHHPAPGCTWGQWCEIGSVYMEGDRCTPKRPIISWYVKSGERFIYLPSLAAVRPSRGLIPKAEQRPTNQPAWEGVLVPREGA